MLVVVQGDPLLLSTTVVGLDILSPRHPKLHALLIDRLGFQLSPDSRVIANTGEVATGCEPDSSGRQVVLRPSLYPTDVLNILMETGGFVLSGTSTFPSGSIVWNLTK